MKVKKEFSNSWNLTFWTRIFFNLHVYFSTHGFIALKRSCNLPTCAFDFVTRAIRLLTRNFELVTCAFENVTRSFELLIRKFELITRGFELGDLHS